MCLVLSVAGSTGGIFGDPVLVVLGDAVGLLVIMEKWFKDDGESVMFKDDGEYVRFKDDEESEEFFCCFR